MQTSVWEFYEFGKYDEEKIIRILFIILVHLNPSKVPSNLILSLSERLIDALKLPQSNWMLFFSKGIWESSNLEIILGVSCVVCSHRKPMPVLWIYNITFKLFMFLVTDFQK